MRLEDVRGGMRVIYTGAESETNFDEENLIPPKTLAGTVVRRLLPEEWSGRGNNTYVEWDKPILMATAIGGIVLLSSRRL